MNDFAEFCAAVKLLRCTRVDLWIKTVPIFGADPSRLSFVVRKK